MKWISVDDALPEHGVDVLAVYKNDWGKKRMIIAHHFERWTEESMSGDCSDEYSDELDNYYLKEGWYENLENWDEYSSIYIGSTVSRWAKLPDFPDGL